MCPKPNHGTNGYYTFYFQFHVPFVRWCGCCIFSRPEPVPVRVPVSEWVSWVYQSSKIKWKKKWLHRDRGNERSHPQQHSIHRNRQQNKSVMLYSRIIFYFVVVVAISSSLSLSAIEYVVEAYSQSPIVVRIELQFIQQKKKYCMKKKMKIIVEPEPLKEYIIIMVVCEMRTNGERERKKKRAKSDKNEVIAREKMI